MIENLAYLVLGFILGVVAMSMMRQKINEQIYERGLKEGVEMVMEHLDEAREVNHQLVEVIKNVTNRNTIH